MLKKMANVFGWILLVLGVLGFVPGITTDAHLFGIFDVNAVHNLIHIITGLAALYMASKGEDQSQMFFKVFGVIFALIAILGFMAGDSMILGFISSNNADTWLHVVIAVIALWLGFGSKKASSMQTA